MNVALALSSIAHGATVLNHMEVLELIKAPRVGKKDSERIIGAVVKDVLTGEIVNVKAKGVINATGPFTDAIRKMDDPSVDVIVSPSSGTHITLPNYYRYSIGTYFIALNIWVSLIHLLVMEESFSFYHGRGV